MQLTDPSVPLLKAMPEGLAKEGARIELDEASQFERLHPTPEQVDALWRNAMWGVRNYPQWSHGVSRVKRFMHHCRQ